MDSINIIKPDDWHIHLRDGEALQRTVTDAARQFSRAIVMPNLVPPVTKVEDAYAYRKRIIQQIPQGNQFNPLMTLYLTDNTSPQEIEDAVKSGFVKAVKLYPSGATTNSDSGVTDIFALAPVFKVMEELDLPLLIHGEVVDSSVDIFDREKYFIDQVLCKLIAAYPRLRIVMEHITTKDAVEFILQTEHPIAATITAHHLLFNRNDLLVGGVKPHFYCLPILKRNTHQQSLLEAATSGSPRFFLGTDSAPHSFEKKESACGCAGCYTAYSAIELYAMAFDQVGKIDQLENFASINGPTFYQLPINTETIQLKKKPWTLPKSLDFGDSVITPLLSGEEITWQRVNG